MLPLPSLLSLTPRADEVASKERGAFPPVLFLAVCLLLLLGDTITFSGSSSAWFLATPLGGSGGGGTDWEEEGMARWRSSWG